MTIQSDTNSGDNEVMIPTLMYLAHEQWSPRFENTFYSIKMDKFELLVSSPDQESIIHGKTNHPAYYYNVQVFCGRSKHSILRRYSQFEWLFQQLRHDITAASIDLQQQDPSYQASNDPYLSLRLPPGTWFCQSQNNSFASNRLEQLREFLRDLLEVPGAANHPAVLAFLEVETFFSS